MCQPDTLLITAHSWTSAACVHVLYVSTASGWWTSSWVGVGICQHQREGGGKERGMLTFNEDCDVRCPPGLSVALWLSSFLHHVLPDNRRAAVGETEDAGCQYKSWLIRASVIFAKEKFDPSSQNRLSDQSISCLEAANQTQQHKHTESYQRITACEKLHFPT